MTAPLAVLDSRGDRHYPWRIRTLATCFIDVRRVSLVGIIGTNVTVYQVMPVVWIMLAGLLLRVVVIKRYTASA